MKMTPLKLVRQRRLQRLQFLCIALAMLVLAAGSTGVAADSSLPASRRAGTEAPGSDSSGKPEKSTPANQFLTAYNSMEMADWLKEKGMRAEAADLYTEALDIFSKVSADYPQWQPAIVAFRINYCRAALGSVERKASSGEREEALLRHGATEGTQPTAKNRQAGSASRPDKSAIINPQSKIGNQAAAASPLTFKLQQAALKERGGDYTGALELYSALLIDFPLEPWALKGACRCCLRLGRMNMARVLIRQAQALPAPDADLKLLAALIECNGGRYQEAIALLRQSLKLKGASPEAHVALGVALAATGEMKAAQEEMKQALAFNPKLGDAYYNLARLSLQQKPTDHDTPRVHYQNALRHGVAPDPELDKLLAE